jgi:hypothetical protein
MRLEKFTDGMRDHPVGGQPPVRPTHHPVCLQWLVAADRRRLLPRRGRQRQPLNARLDIEITPLPVCSNPRCQCHLPLLPVANAATASLTAVQPQPYRKHLVKMPLFRLVPRCRCQTGSEMKILTRYSAHLYDATVLPKQNSQHQTEMHPSDFRGYLEQTDFLTPAALAIP